jgi:hypothetical protein
MCQIEQAAQLVKFWHIFQKSLVMLIIWINCTPCRVIIYLLLSHQKSIVVLIMNCAPSRVITYTNLDLIVGRLC